MTDSPITKDRFSSGKTYAEYVESGIRNRELFDDNYNGTAVSEAQAAALKDLSAKPNGPKRLAVIGEDWCPDVYRGMPVAARIAEAAGLEMRVFERDQNKDLIQSYLNGGEFESIPVLVFFSDDHQEIGHFIERPKIANEQMGEVAEITRGAQPQVIAQKLGHEPSEEETAAARAEVREKYMAWQKGETWASWRSATVDEVIDLLRDNT